MAVCLEVISALPHPDRLSCWFAHSVGGRAASRLPRLEISAAA